MVSLEIFEDSESVQIFKMKTVTNPASCSFKFLDTSNLVLIFRLVPFISIPSYLLAWLLISRNKTKVVQSVKKHYLRQMAINFFSVILLCHIICPILMPPIPGYFMTGFLDDLDANIALPLVLMTHVVLLVAFAILRLFKHQLITLSDLRYTKKFELPVKILKWSYRFCYLMMFIVAVSILPTLSIELESTGFRQEAYQYFNKSVCFCPEMFIADPRKWEIYIPYYLSVTFGGLCTITGISSVITCLWMMFDSRKIVSRDTLIMQRNFTFILVYQAFICIFFIIFPLASVSTLFYTKIFISEHGLYYLLLISCQGSVNNFTHIVPGLWRKLRKKVVVPTDSRNSRKGSSMWSTSTHLTASIS